MASKTQEQVFRQQFDWLTRLLDSSLVLPGTTKRFGLDPLIGLLPVIGDALSAALSGWLLYLAHRLGASKPLLAKMAANIMLDLVVGSVPVLGDLFDFVWTANQRNRQLLQAFLAERDDRQQTSLREVDDAG